ncbi:YceI family protein [Jannaschia formosa]|uniref:YceI family protein n=1 Tax=Jannaschia formosa TaxID=2259592 RepID=UPI000E1C2934|nr:YceI family protein [Jannaschia formosa]TFL19747.1 polyisoprenoid-binding protein [Jannaschia formosa]
MIRTFALSALAAAAFTAPALASGEAGTYTLDPSHSQILFSYDHLGFSTTYGMFSGFEGTIEFDAENPAESSVSVSMPLSSMFTGWEQRDAHFASPDFFDAAANQTVSFVSTGIEVTGENTALITGDLTLGGVTKPVVLDTVLNQAASHPMENKPWLGFDATTTLLRSEFDAGMFAPFISDEVEVRISVEAQKAD